MSEAKEYLLDAILFGCRKPTISRVSPRKAARLFFPLIPPSVIRFYQLPLTEAKGKLEHSTERVEMPWMEASWMCSDRRDREHTFGEILSTIGTRWRAAHAVSGAIDRERTRRVLSSGLGRGHGCSVVVPTVRDRTGDRPSVARAVAGGGAIGAERSLVSRAGGRGTFRAETGRQRPRAGDPCFRVPLNARSEPEQDDGAPLAPPPGPRARRPHPSRRLTRTTTSTSSSSMPGGRLGMPMTRSSPGAMSTTSPVEAS